MKILIIKTSALGDIIHAFPVLQFLSTFGQVDWVVEKPFAELVQSHPNINHVFPVQTKKWRKNWWKKSVRQEIKNFRQQLQAHTYDIVFDLQGNIKSGLILANVKSPLKVGFGFKSVSEWPNWLFTNRQYNPPAGKNIREDYLYLAEKGMDKETFPSQTAVKLNIPNEEETKIANILAQPALQNSIRIMVCPGSNWTNKQLSPLALKTFLKQIHDELPASFLCVWGSPEEKILADEITNLFPNRSVTVEKLALSTLQNLQSQVDLVIAMDSLPLHLAGTTETPTYSVFGASLLQKYKPMGKHHQGFQGGCPYGQVFHKRCEMLRTCATGSCIKSIQGQNLYSHFIHWWQGFH